MKVVSIGQLQKEPEGLPQTMAAAVAAAGIQAGAVTQQCCIVKAYRLHTVFVESGIIKQPASGLSTKKAVWW